ncbi:MAG: potassium/proton antiporter [Paludibacteraceae bacterium]|nr:potassium/proton antiporter [Paludibacteraceae bacterium]
MQVELVLLVLSMLFFFSIIADKIGYKFGVPALLLFLTVGMLFGPDGIGRIFNDDGVGYMLNVSSAEALSSVALCVILFSGGMDTKLRDINPVMAQGVTLATLGVLITAAVTGMIVYYIFGWMNALVSISVASALLMASTLSSTDSASVFSIMRTNGINLKHGLRPILELESGANDPMAYVLTSTMIGVCLSGSAEVSGLTIVQDIVVQLVMGAVLGFAFGKGVVRLMREVQLANESLYSIMVLTSCIFIFSMTFFLKGNPYLAVYVGGLIIGNSKFTRKRQTKSFFDGLTWLSQLVMFLMLGLLVRPLELLHWQVLLPCFIISVVMIFISRPLAVLLCMAPFRQYNIKDKMMLSWVGLKGAVPIIFAIMCLAEGVEHADMLFNVVFLCTLVSLLVQGTTITRVARKLDLAVDPPQLKRLVHFDIDLPEEIESSATEIEVTDDMMLGGCRLRDLQIPSHTLVIMVRRGEDFFVPTGQSELQAGDQLLVITDNDVEMAYQYQQQMQAEDESQWSIQMLTNTKDFFRDLWKKITKN